LIVADRYGFVDARTEAALAEALDEGKLSNSDYLQFAWNKVLRDERARAHGSSRESFSNVSPILFGRFQPLAYPWRTN
jgi:hypothetical protein